MADAVRVRAEILKEMLLHARREPEIECCGLLAGRDGVITRAFPAVNVASNPKRRYEIAPAEIVRLMREFRERKLGFLGIYHSHPDCGAYFSETDLKNSCPWYSFVVLSIQQGRFDHANSWLPNAEQTQAEKEELLWPES